MFFKKVFDCMDVYMYMYIMLMMRTGEFEKENVCCHNSCGVCIYWVKDDAQDSREIQC